MGEPERSFEERRQEAERKATADRDARAAKLAAGMGFWRLVFVVAMGVLFAQLIGGLVAALWARVTG